jgi:hypothetical protein
MNRNRIRNHDALTPILIPKIRPSANELPPSINREWSHSIASTNRRGAQGCAAGRDFEEMTA